MKKLVTLWKTQPKVRFAVRTFVVAAAGYIVQSYRGDNPLTWTALAAGAATAGITALVGLTTPVEPHVGINKTEITTPPSP